MYSLVCACAYHSRQNSGINRWLAVSVEASLPERTHSRNFRTSGPARQNLQPSCQARKSQYLQESDQRRSLLALELQAEFVTRHGTMGYLVALESGRHVVVAKPGGVEPLF